MEDGSSSSSEQYLLERILDGKEKPTDLSLVLLQKITNDFSKERKIGQGGFGAVYKGVLGERNVAVKRIYLNIERIDDDDKQFGREFTSLWNTNHQNVIQFLGFCSNIHQKLIQRDGSEESVWANVRERLFCFEYIRNGSLDKHITDELRGLEWEKRYEIIMGICKGLHYLHEEKSIIHMDLKPENILLDHQDEKYIPKITDFGLSRPNEKSYTVGKVYGTRGYCAPEYSEGKNITPACDIYSLGAIIRELVTGCMEIPNKDNVLRRWRHRWRKPPTPLQYERITRCMEIAVQCREIKPEARPSIFEIISFLSVSENASGHTGQEISTYFDDDMLGIEPLELHFTLKLKKDDGMHGIVKLTNKTKACFAFNIERPSKQYTVWPDRGIVPPGCIEYPVQITMQPEVIVPQVTRNAENFIVRSTKVSESLGVEDVTEHIFHPGTGKVVDEVDLMVLYGSVSIKRGREPNVPVEVVSHKAIKSSSYKDYARAQCTKQLDRLNFHPPENFSHNQPTNMTYLLRESDRAMSVTTGAMGSLLHKLGVLHMEFNMKTSIEEDANELVNMQQVLRKVSDVQQDNKLVRRWASNVREMSYDLEDFVDGFLMHSEPDSDGSDFRGLTHEMYLDKGESHQPISDMMKHYISKHVQDAAKKCKECKVEDVIANATTKADIEDPRISGIHIPREQLIGIEAPKKKLMSMLEEDGDKSKLNIVSIFGFGGLGKTTLAKAVYDKIQAQYLHRAFVPVGQNPNVKKILKNILYACGKNLNAENLEVWQLQDEVHELLNNKRYFIVIDDIWGSLEWNGIRPAFPQNENGSRLMITTRDRNVALVCCNYESKHVHEIRPLSDEDSKRLFFRRIFGSRTDCYITPRKEEISKYILERCRGMPLAINSIASLLAVGKDSSWEYARKSLGALTEGNDALSNMKKILDLSYIHLPDHLKACLLYVCMYPEDCEIYKIELLRKWVAEGFVHVSRNGVLDAEHVAEQYFEVLINMCLIQPDKIDYNNEVLSCKVHDIILDLIRSKSAEVNFIQVIDGLKDVLGPHGEIHRVSVQNNDKEDGRILKTIKGSLSHVRSVLLYRASLIPDFLEYKYVRVLHIEDNAYRMVLDLTAISSLFLLRYLKVACDPCSYYELKLPDQIGWLQQLETIDLKGWLPENCPSDIVTLPWLSHLRYSGWRGTMLPDGIESLKSLHTLEGVYVGQSSVETIIGLGELTDLRNLGISLEFSSELEEVEKSARMNALHSSISRLSTSLRILTLEAGLHQRHDLRSWSRTPFPPGSQIQKLHIDCIFQRCPEWVGQLHYLYSLHIEVREVAGGINIVGGLPSLAYFRLCVQTSNIEKEENVVIPGSGAFEALKNMILECNSICVLTFGERAMPKLEKLNMSFRYKTIRGLAYIPVGIEHLPAPSLKEVSVNVNGWLDDWKVKGSEHWNDRAWKKYRYSYHYADKVNAHGRKTATRLKRAFKSHHPSADILISFADCDYSDSEDVDEENYEEDGNEQHDEDAYDDEDYYSNEEDDGSVDYEDLAVLDYSQHRKHRYDKTCRFPVQNVSDTLIRRIPGASFFLKLKKKEKTRIRGRDAGDTSGDTGLPNRAQ